MTAQTFVEDEITYKPVTEEDLKALSHIDAARAAASSGKGNPPAIIDQYRAAHRPDYHPATLGAHVSGRGGPVAPLPYELPLGLDPRNVDHLLPKRTAHDVDANGHPINVRQEAEHADVLASTRNAFDSAFKALDRVSKARAAAAANEAWTPAQQLLNVGGMADKTLDQVTQSFDRARKNLTDFIAALDKSLNAPIEGGTRDPLAIEIREYMQKLPETKRAAFVAEAMKNNETKTLQAVLGAPHYLSGLGKADHDKFTRDYRAASNPVAAARLEVARKGLELLEARAGLIFTELERAMGGSFKKLKAIREANSAAEQALVMQNGIV